MISPEEIVATGLASAGDCDLAIIVTHTAQLNLRWAANSLTTNGDTSATQVDVVAMHPSGGTATTSGQVSDPAAIVDLVARSREAAMRAQSAADRRELPRGEAADDWADAPEQVSGDTLAPLATGLGRQFREDAQIRHFGYAEQDATTTYLATTAGTRTRHVQVQSRVEFTAKDATGTRSAWHGAADLGVDVAAVGHLLRTGLEQQRTTLAATPGRQRVILSPSATADLMIDLYFAADARAALDGRSVFAGPTGPRIGEQIGGDVTLSSDPHHPAASMACGPFEVTAASSDSSSVFDNGLPLTATDWIRSGRLTNLISTRHTAAELGRSATPGIDNLTLSVASGSGTLADLVARTESALLVTCVWYNRVVDPQTLLLTGLTRDGVYVVRDGQIVGAGGNFRFNESPVSLLGRIVDASDEERTLAREMGDYFNRATMPALMVEDFNLSTASEAH